MSYVIKVPNRNTFVKAYYVDSKAKDRNVHLVFTDNPKNALTFDDMDDVAIHYDFILNNMSILDLGTQPICIAEAQVCYKEL
nr:MAG TPA: hypothetical protein [Bacteriophage sp.]